MAQENNYLTTTEVANILHVTLGTVINMIKKGRFPGAYKVDPGSKSIWRIPQSGLDAFLEARKQSEPKSA
jgi:excisionase family DNA binding protein